LQVFAANSCKFLQSRNIFQQLRFYRLNLQKFAEMRPANHFWGDQRRKAVKGWRRGRPIRKDQASGDFRHRPCRKRIRQDGAARAIRYAGSGTVPALFQEGLVAMGDKKRKPGKPGPKPDNK